MSEQRELPSNNASSDIFEIVIQLNRDISRIYRSTIGDINLSEDTHVAIMNNDINLYNEVIDMFENSGIPQDECFKHAKEIDYIGFSEFVYGGSCDLRLLIEEADKISISHLTYDGNITELYNNIQYNFKILLSLIKLSENTDYIDVLLEHNLWLFQHIYFTHVLSACYFDLIIYLCENNAKCLTYIFRELILNFSTFKEFYYSGVGSESVYLYSIFDSISKIVTSRIDDGSVDISNFNDLLPQLVDQSLKVIAIDQKRERQSYILFCSTVFINFITNLLDIPELNNQPIRIIRSIQNVFRQLEYGHLFRQVQEHILYDIYDLTQCSPETELFHSFYGLIPKLGEYFVYSPDDFHELFLYTMESIHTFTDKYKNDEIEFPLLYDKDIYLHTFTQHVFIYANNYIDYMIYNKKKVNFDQNSKIDIFTSCINQYINDNHIGNRRDLLYQIFSNILHPLLLLEQKQVGSMAKNGMILSSHFGILLHDCIISYMYELTQFFVVNGKLVDFEFTYDSFLHYFFERINYKNLISHITPDMKKNQSLMLIHRYFYVLIRLTDIPKKYDDFRDDILDFVINCVCDSSIDTPSCLDRLGRRRFYHLTTVIPIVQEIYTNRITLLPHTKSHYQIKSDQHIYYRYHNIEYSGSHHFNRHILEDISDPTAHVISKDSIYDIYEDFFLLLNIKQYVDIYINKLIEMNLYQYDSNHQPIMWFLVRCKEFGYEDMLLEYSDYITTQSNKFTDQLLINLSRILRGAFSVPKIKKRDISSRYHQLKGKARLFSKKINVGSIDEDDNQNIDNNMCSICHTSVISGSDAYFVGVAYQTIYPYDMDIEKFMYKTNERLLFKSDPNLFGSIISNDYDKYNFGLHLCQHLYHYNCVHEQKYCYYCKFQYNRIILSATPINQAIDNNQLLNIKIEDILNFQPTDTHSKWKSPMPFSNSMHNEISMISAANTIRSIANSKSNYYSLHSLLSIIVSAQIDQPPVINHFDITLKMLYVIFHCSTPVDIISILIYFTMISIFILPPNEVNHHLNQPIDEIGDEFSGIYCDLYDKIFISSVKFIPKDIDKEILTIISLLYHTFFLSSGDFIIEGQAKFIINQFNIVNLLRKISNDDNLLEIFKKTVQSLNSTHYKLILRPMFQLPPTYNDFLKYIENNPCTNCQYHYKKKTDNTATCLFCGKVLCRGTCCYNSRDQCEMLQHSSTHNLFGLYYLEDDNYLLLHSSKNKCLRLSMIYKSVDGVTDVRANKLLPLELDKKEYDKIVEVYNDQSFIFYYLSNYFNYIPQDLL